MAPAPIPRSEAASPALVFDPLSERLVALTPSLARLVLEPRVGADRQQRLEALGEPRRHVQREPAAHRVADEVGALDPEVIPQHLEVRGAGVHRARRAWLDPRLTMAPKVGHHPLPTGGHGRDELLPTAAALGEAVEKGDRRAFAGDEIV